MTQVAFALRADFVDSNFAGTVALPDGIMYDVGDALTQGKGTIVSDDAHIIDALDRYPAVKRTAVPEAAAKGYEPAPTVDPKYAGLSGEANEGIVPDSPVPTGPAPTGKATATATPSGKDGEK